MASLSPVEVRQLETLFEMSGGYVLDFSNRTFAEFFLDTLRVDIYDERYDYGSGSKANRLRGFLKNAPDRQAGVLLLALVDYAEAVSQSPDRELVAICKVIATRLASSKPDAQSLQDLVEGNAEQQPRIFISYSWDSEDHKAWVRKLADTLMENGLQTTLDQYDLKIGEDRFRFMESSVRDASVVLCVCTPEYVEKANLRTSGVGVETALITPRFFERMRLKRQFIPVVRKTEAGTPHTPDYMSSLIFIDFRVDRRFNAQIEQLLRHLYDEPELVKPPIGRRPSFSSPTQSVPEELGSSQIRRRYSQHAVSPGDDLRIATSPRFLTIQDSEIVQLPPSNLGGAGQVHLFDSETVSALNAALAAGRPLLVEGEPGIGTRTLGLAAAQLLGWPYLRLRMSSHTKAADLLWTLDQDRRLVEAQLLGARKTYDEHLQDALKTKRFVRPGLLWWAFDWNSAAEQASVTLDPMPEIGPGARPENGVVLNLESVDRSESEVLVDLMATLGEGRFLPPGFSNPVESRSPLLVIMTSTAEKLLPHSFLRQCLVLRPTLPQSHDDLVELMARHGGAHFPDADEYLLRCAAEYVASDRIEAIDGGRTVPPGIAEFLDLVRAAIALGATAEDQVQALKTIARYAVRQPPMERI